MADDFRALVAALHQHSEKGGKVAEPDVTWVPCCGAINMMERQCGMSGIGRMWRGWTNSDQADGYEAVFRGVVLPELRDVAGCRGAYLLRHDDADGTEFVTLTLFDSLDAVRAFAGEQFETAVISKEARAVLRDFEPTARHFTLVVAPDDSV